ncbi:hypothetical protein FKM82_008122 [Ascaphus truei]
MQSESLDIELPQNSALEENAALKELNTTERSASDEVKKDTSRKKSKKHKKHKSKKKKKKKKKEKDEKRSKSTSSVDDQENVYSEPKSLWKPAFESPAREDNKVDAFLSKTETLPDTNISVPSCKSVQEGIPDSIKESQPVGTQIDMDLGFFGPKCPNEITSYTVPASCSTAVEMKELLETSAQGDNQDSETVKQIEACEKKDSMENKHATKSQSRSPSESDTEIKLSQSRPDVALSHSKRAESNSNKLDSAEKLSAQSTSLSLSMDFHHQSDKNIPGRQLRSRSKSTSEKQQSSAAKPRSRSKSVTRKHRSRSKSLRKPGSESQSTMRKHKSRSKSSTRKKSRSKSTPRRRWSKGRQIRSKSPIEGRRSRSSSPVRRRRSRSISPVRRRRSRSSSLVRRRRSRSSSPVRRRISRSISPVRRRRSRSSSPVRRRISRSSSPVRRRRSRSRSLVRRRRSPSRSPVRRRRSPSSSPVRGRRSPSSSPVRRRRSRSRTTTRCSKSKSPIRRWWSRSTTNRQKSRSRSTTRRRWSRSRSTARRRRSRSKSTARKGSRSKKHRSKSSSVRNRTRSRSVKKKRQDESKLPNKSPRSNSKLTAGPNKEQAKSSANPQKSCTETPMLKQSTISLQHISSYSLTQTRGQDNSLSHSPSKTPDQGQNLSCYTSPVKQRLSVVGLPAEQEPLQHMSSLPHLFDLKSSDELCPFSHSSIEQSSASTKLFNSTTIPIGRNRFNAPVTQSVDVRTSTELAKEGHCNSIDQLVPREMDIDLELENFQLDSTNELKDERSKTISDFLPEQPDSATIQEPGKCATPAGVDIFESSTIPEQGFVESNALKKDLCAFSSTMKSKPLQPFVPKGTTKHGCSEIFVDHMNKSKLVPEQVFDAFQLFSECKHPVMTEQELLKPDSSSENKFLSYSKDKQKQLEPKVTTEQQHLPTASIPADVELSMSHDIAQPTEQKHAKLSLLLENFESNVCVKPKFLRSNTHNEQEIFEPNTTVEDMFVSPLPSGVRVREIIQPGIYTESTMDSELTEHVTARLEADQKHFKTNLITNEECCDIRTPAKHVSSSNTISEQSCSAAPVGTHLFESNVSLPHEHLEWNAVTDHIISDLSAKQKPSVKAPYTFFDTPAVKEHWQPEIIQNKNFDFGVSENQRSTQSIQQSQYDMSSPVVHTSTEIPKQELFGSRTDSIVMNVDTMQQDCSEISQTNITSEVHFKDKKVCLAIEHSSSDLIPVLGRLDMEVNSVKSNVTVKLATQKDYKCATELALIEDTAVLEQLPSKSLSTSPEQRQCTLSTEPILFDSNLTTEKGLFKDSVTTECLDQRDPISSGNELLVLDNFTGLEVDNSNSQFEQESLKSLQHFEEKHSETSTERGLKEKATKELGLVEITDITKIEVFDEAKHAKLNITSDLNTNSNVISEQGTFQLSTIELMDIKASNLITEQEQIERKMTSDCQPAENFTAEQVFHAPQLIANAWPCVGELPVDAEPCFSEPPTHVDLRVCVPPADDEQRVCVPPADDEQRVCVPPADDEPACRESRREEEKRVLRGRQTEAVCEPPAEDEQRPVCEPPAEDEQRPVCEPPAEDEQRPVCEPPAEHEQRPVCEPPGVALVQRAFEDLADVQRVYASTAYRGQNACKSTAATEYLEFILADNQVSNEEETAESTTPHTEVTYESSISCEQSSVTHEQSDVGFLESRMAHDLKVYKSFTADAHRICVSNYAVCEFTAPEQEMTLKDMAADELKSSTDKEKQLYGSITANEQRVGDPVHDEQRVFQPNLVEHRQVESATNTEHFSIITEDSEMQKKLSIVSGNEPHELLLSTVEKPSDYDETIKLKQMTAELTDKGNLKLSTKQKLLETTVQIIPELSTTNKQSVSLFSTVNDQDSDEVCRSTTCTTETLEQPCSSILFVEEPFHSYSDDVPNSNMTVEEVLNPITAGLSKLSPEFFGCTKIAKQESNTITSQLLREPSASTSDIPHIQESNFDLHVEQEPSVTVVQNSLQTIEAVEQSCYKEITGQQLFDYTFTELELYKSNATDKTKNNEHTPEFVAEMVSPNVSLSSWQSITEQDSAEQKGFKLTKTKDYDHPEILPKQDVCRLNLELDNSESFILNKHQHLESATDPKENRLSTSCSEPVLFDSNQNKAHVEQCLSDMTTKSDMQKSIAVTRQKRIHSPVISVPVPFKFSRTFKPLKISPFPEVSQIRASSGQEPSNVSILSMKDPLQLSSPASSALCGPGPPVSSTVSGLEPPQPSSTSATEIAQSSALYLIEPLQSSSPAGPEPLQSSSPAGPKPSQSSSPDGPEPSQTDSQLGREPQQTDTAPRPESSQSSVAIKHTFPHLSHAISKLGVKQRQYRSRSMAQESRSPSKSVDRGRSSRSRSKSVSRKRRSRSKSVDRKKQSQSSTRRRRSRSKSATRRRSSRSKSAGKRRRSHSRSAGRKRCSRSNSKGRQRRPRSKSAGRRKRSRSKSVGKRRRSRSKLAGRKRRSKSVGRRKRLRSKSIGRKIRSRSKSAGKRGRSRTKSPTQRRRSCSKSISRRSRSKSASWRHRSHSRQRRQTQSSSKSTSPTRCSRSRRGRSISRSPAPWRRSRSRSRARWRRSRSRARWRRSRSLSISKLNRSRSASRLSRSVSKNKRRRSMSKSPIRRRRSRSHTRPRDRSKSHLSRHKSKSSSPPQKRKAVSPAVKQTAGLKSLIQKQLFQPKSPNQNSCAMLPSKELPVPDLALEILLPVPNLTSGTQLIVSNMAASTHLLKAVYESTVDQQLSKFEQPAQKDIPLLSEPLVCTDHPLSAEMLVHSDVPLLAEPAFCSDVPLLAEPTVCSDVPLLGEPTVCSDVPLLAEPTVCSNGPCAGRNPLLLTMYRLLSHQCLSIPSTFANTLSSSYFPLLAEPTVCSNVPLLAEPTVCSDVPLLAQPTVCSDVPLLAEHAIFSDVPLLAEPGVCSDVPLLAETAVCSDIPLQAEHTVCSDVPLLSEHAVCSDVPLPAEHPVSSDVPLPAEHHFCSYVPLPAPHPSARPNTRLLGCPPLPSEHPVCRMSALPRTGPLCSCPPAAERPSARCPLFRPNEPSARIGPLVRPNQPRLLECPSRGETLRMPSARAFCSYVPLPADISLCSDVPFLPAEHPVCSDVPCHTPCRVLAAAPLVCWMSLSAGQQPSLCGIVPSLAQPRARLLGCPSTAGRRALLLECLLCPAEALLLGCPLPPKSPFCSDVLWPAAKPVLARMSLGPAEEAVCLRMALCGRRGPSARIPSAGLRAQCCRFPSAGRESPSARNVHSAGRRPVCSDWSPRPAEEPVCSEVPLSLPRADPSARMSLCRPNSPSARMSLCRPNSPSARMSLCRPNSPSARMSLCRPNTRVSALGVSLWAGRTPPSARCPASDRTAPRSSPSAGRTALCLGMSLCRAEQPFCSDVPAAGRTASASDVPLAVLQGARCRIPLPAEEPPSALDVPLPAEHPPVCSDFPLDGRRGPSAPDFPLASAAANEPSASECPSVPAEESRLLRCPLCRPNTPPSSARVFPLFPLPPNNTPSASMTQSVSELSHELLHADQNDQITPPDLLPYDSEQPTVLHLTICEPSSEQVLFSSQPPPELLPYDSEQPADLHLSIAEYPSEQASSIFCTPPELLPYDSDQPSGLSTSYSGTPTEKFTSVYLTSDKLSQSVPESPAKLLLPPAAESPSLHPLGMSNYSESHYELISVYKQSDEQQHFASELAMPKMSSESPYDATKSESSKDTSHGQLVFVPEKTENEQLNSSDSFCISKPTEQLISVSEVSDDQLLSIPSSEHIFSCSPELPTEKQHSDCSQRLAVLESLTEEPLSVSDQLYLLDLPVEQSPVASELSLKQPPSVSDFATTSEQPVLVSEEQSVLVSEEQPVLVSEEQPVLVSEEKPVFVSEEQPVLNVALMPTWQEPPELAATKKRSRSKSVTKKHSHSVSRKKRSHSKSVDRKRSRSKSMTRRKRSRSKSVTRRKKSRSKSTTRKRSQSKSVTRRRQSRSKSTTRRRRSRSAARKRRSRSLSAARKRRSLSAARKRRSRSKSVARKRRSRSKSVARKRRTRSKSVARKRRTRSKSVARKRRSRSKSITPTSPTRKQHAQSKSDRSRSRSQSNITRKRKTRSKSTSRDRNKSSEKRHRRSNSKENYSVKSRRRSRTPARRKKSRSPIRRKSLCVSPIRRRRSRSPIRRKSFSRSPIRRKRSRSRDKSKDSSRSPKRLTDLDKAQLLEIAKANAAAMCAKAGVPLPQNLKPTITPVAQADEKVTNRSYGVTIQELTEKCKQIQQSKEDDVIINKPHDSDEEEEERPFYNHPFKVNEHKPISFSLLNPTIKPAPKTPVILTKEFPVSSGSQHRKKEADKVYGEWVPVDKKTEESKDDVFTNTNLSQPVDITSAMTERAVAQTRLTGNPFDLEALCMLNRAQEQIDAWAQSTSIPGQFTGSTGAQVLTPDEISNSGPQAWLKKDQFLRAAPVTGGRGALLMRKMGWREGEGLGRYKEGNVNPILVDFKIDRKGLVADGEKAPNKLALPAMKDLFGKHPISALMELCNKRKWSPPEFVLVDNAGPDHRKRFLFRVTVNGVLHQPNQASLNKKLAKATAAAAALQGLGALPKESMTSITNFRSASDSNL